MFRVSTDEREQSREIREGSWEWQRRVESDHQCTVRTTKSVWQPERNQDIVLSRRIHCIEPVRPLIVNRGRGRSDIISTKGRKNRQFAQKCSRKLSCCATDFEEARIRREERNTKLSSKCKQKQQFRKMLFLPPAILIRFELNSNKRDTPENRLD